MALSVDFDDRPINGISILLVALPLIAYGFIFLSQYRALTKKALRLQVLVTRVSLFLPTYATLIFISLLAPKLFAGLEILIAIAEGYFFLCFFTLLVENLGGPSKTVGLLEHQGRPLLCGCCCPGEYARFYRRVKWALFHFLFTRSFVVTIQSACSYATSKIAAKLAFAFAIISFMFVINGFGSLVIFFESVLRASSNLNGVYKMILLKVSVGIIVLQGLIEEILWATGEIKLDSTSMYTAEERAQRIFCLAVLCEYALLSLPFYLAFSSAITINKVSLDDHHPALGSHHANSRDLEGSVNSQFSMKRSVSVEGSVRDQADRDEERPDITFCGFVLSVLRVQDIYYAVCMRGKENDLQESLLNTGHCSDAVVNALRTAAHDNDSHPSAGTPVHA